MMSGSTRSKPETSCLGPRRHSIVPSSRAMLQPDLPSLLTAPDVVKLETTPWGSTLLKAPPQGLNDKPQGCAGEAPWRRQDQYVVVPGRRVAVGAKDQPSLRASGENFSRHLCTERRLA